MKNKRPKAPPTKATPTSEIEETTGVGRNEVEDKMVDFLDEWELFKDLEPMLRQALRSGDVKSMLKGGSLWSMAQMIKLAKDTRSDAVKYSVLKDILDRAGYKPAEKNVNINANDLTDGEIDAKISSLTKELEDKETKH